MSISKIINTNLDMILRGISLLSPINNNIYNKNIITKYGNTKYSFQGHFHCGESIFMIKQILDKYNIKNIVYKSNKLQYIHNEYISDHCFILIDDELIVDLTYRQFIIDPYIHFDINNNLFYKSIFLDKSPLFLGTKSNLYSELFYINKEYINYYNKNLINCNDILKFWNKDHNITYKFTLDYFKKNHSSLDNYKDILKLIN